MRGRGAREEVGVNALTSTDIAAVCYEAHRVYCSRIGDSSPLSWSQAPDRERESAIKRVEFGLAHPNSRYLALGFSRETSERTVVKDRTFRAIIEALRPMMAVKIRTPEESA
jgi:hypothetical protein